MPEVGIELYKLIKVSGPDAVDFLQGQLTQDIAQLASEGRMLAAWCSPKGRVIVIMRLVSLTDGIGLIVPANMAETIMNKLLLYRFRANVDLAVTDDDVAELIEPAERDPVALIEAGMPHIDLSNTEEFTPHMLNLDKLGAISFSKGCYTGQEIVARTENLGKSKRRLMRYKADGNGIKVGDKLSYGDRSVGEVVNVTNRDLLAVAPVAGHDQPLKLGTATISPQGLPYEI